MKTLYALNLKLLLKKWPALLLAAVFMVAIGMASSRSMAGRAASLSILCVDGDRSQASAQFWELLQGIPGISMRFVDDAQEAIRTLYDAGDVQGAVVLSQGFSQRVERDGRNAVELHVAPGIQDVSVLKEHLASSVLQLRAGRILQSDAFSIAQSPGVYASVIRVTYEGPALLAGEVSPYYGAQALLVTGLFFVGAWLLPSPQWKRTLYLGGRSVARLYAAAVLAVVSVTAAFLTVCFAAQHALVEGGILRPIVALATLGLYACALGGLTACTLPARSPLLVFLPWFILNMTIGGALWGVVPVPAWVGLFVPVMLCARAIAGYADALLAMLAMAGLFAAVHLAWATRGARRQLLARTRTQ